MIQQVLGRMLFWPAPSLGEGFRWLRCRVFPKTTINDSIIADFKVSDLAWQQALLVWLCFFDYTLISSSSLIISEAQAC